MFGLSWQIAGVWLCLTLSAKPTNMFLQSSVCGLWDKTTFHCKLALPIFITRYENSVYHHVSTCTPFFMKSPQQTMCFHFLLSLTPLTTASINLLYGLLLLACSSIFSILLNNHWPFDVLDPVWPLQLCLHTVLSYTLWCAPSCSCPFFFYTWTRQIHSCHLLSACLSITLPSLLLNVSLHLFSQGCAHTFTHLYSISVGTLSNIIYPNGSYLDA